MSDESKVPDEPGVIQPGEVETSTFIDEIPLETTTTLFPDGFRRVFRFPDPGTLARARALLLEVASRANGGAAAAALAAFPSWESLATLFDTPWLAPARHFSNASVRIIRRRLRLLGSSPVSLPAGPAVRDSTAGGPVHIRGVCVLASGQVTASYSQSAQPVHPVQAISSLGKAAAEVWRVWLRQDFLGDRWVIEEGYDFVLRTPEGAGPLVLARGAHLAGASVLREGDEVSVFGYLDEAPDPTGTARSANGRGGLSLGVRSGVDLPLLVVARNSGTIK